VGGGGGGSSITALAKGLESNAQYTNKEKKKTQLQTLFQFSTFKHPRPVVIETANLLGSVGTHLYPSYSGGRDQEDRSWRPPWANSAQDPILKIPITKMGWWNGKSNCLQA
jgi:hypothetical protein